MKFAERFQLFVRLHFLQMLWNFKGMQNLGCLFTLRPVLGRLYDGAERTEAERRHALFFNTHPYFASICFGVVVRMEEDVKSGAFKKPEMIPILKNRMSGPLAAVGDAFFWETVRPIMASLAVLAAFVFGPGSAPSLIVLAGVVAMYIAQAEAIRWQGLGWGYRYGLEVVEVLKRKDFQGSMRRIRNAGAFLLGIASVVYLLQESPLSPTHLLVRAAILVLLLAATARKLSPTVMLYVVAAAGFFLGVML